MRTIENNIDYREISYNIAGQELHINTIENLKIYAGNTVYINNKKTVLSEEDIETIETAKCECFITKCIKGKREGERIAYRYGDFRIGSYSVYSFSTTPEKEKEVREILKGLEIEIVEL